MNRPHSRRDTRRSFPSLYIRGRTDSKKEECGMPSHQYKISCSTPFYEVSILMIFLSHGR